MDATSIIQKVRYITNDNDSTSYRASDAELLSYINEGVRLVVSIEPKVFNTNIEFTCVPGTFQQLDESLYYQFNAVVRIKNGSSVHKAEISSLSDFNPNWHLDAAAPSINWFSDPDSKTNFYVYPAVPTTSPMQTLIVNCVLFPALFSTSNNTVNLPAYLESALVDYSVYRVESKDDEHVLAGRATGSYQAFMSKLLGKELPMDEK